MSNNAFVKRQIQTQTTVSQPVYDDSVEGLPFYYYFDFRFCVFLIILGVIVGILQFLVAGGLFAIPFMKKKYICIKCKHEFHRLSNPHSCPFCKGMVVSEQDYYQKYQNLENMSRGRIID
jgi:hypothetical protein